MPMYMFECKKCGQYEDLCTWEESEKPKCPKCKRKTLRLISGISGVIFTDPRGTSKEDNFGYVAKTNYEMNHQWAEGERAKNANPYKNIDDMSQWEGKIS